MNADGTNPINLTNHPAWDSSPAWEPAPTLSVSAKGRDWRLYGETSSAATPTQWKVGSCKELSIKEENDDTRIAETAESDMLLL